MLTFDVASTAVYQAMDYGLGSDPEEIVSLIGEFARHSARVTHPQGNRRYGGYVLDVDGTRIYGLAKFDGQPVCPDCYGTGLLRQKVRGEWIDVPCKNPQCQDGTLRERAFA